MAVPQMKKASEWRLWAQLSMGGSIPLRTDLSSSLYVLGNQWVAASAGDAGSVAKKSQSAVGERRSGEWRARIGCSLQRLFNLRHGNRAFAQHFPLFPAQLNDRGRQRRAGVATVEH